MCLQYKDERRAILLDTNRLPNFLQGSQAAYCVTLRIVRRARRARVDEDERAALARLLRARGDERLGVCERCLVSDSWDNRKRILLNLNKRCAGEGGRRAPRVLCWPKGAVCRTLCKAAGHRSVLAQATSAVQQMPQIGLMELALVTGGPLQGLLPALTPPSHPGHRRRQPATLRETRSRAMARAMHPGRRHGTMQYDS